MGWAVIAERLEGFVNSIYFISQRILIDAVPEKPPMFVI